VAWRKLYRQDKNVLTLDNAKMDSMLKVKVGE